MPIRAYLGDASFSPEAVVAMSKLEESLGFRIVRLLYQPLRVFSILAILVGSLRRAVHRG